MYSVFKSNSHDDIFVDSDYVSLRDIVHKVNASGKIQPEEEVQISSTITAWITDITVAEGDTVQSGQMLIALDEKQYRAAYNQTLSSVKSAEANLKQIKSQKIRTESLFEQKLISKQELEQVEASFELASSQLEQARSSLVSREDELSKTKLLAPSYGIVTSLTKEVGEMAVGGMFNPGILMTVADLSRMEVEVNVNENDVVNINVGDTSEIEIDAFPDTIFYGVVSEIAHTAQSLNMGSQQQVTNFKVKVKILDPPNKIRPGMSSTVNIISETIKNTISIPIQSLTSRPENYTKSDKKIGKNQKTKWQGRNDEGSDFGTKNNNIDVVFVLENEFDGEMAPDNQKFALIKPILVGISSENYYAVQSGVKEGDLIVTGGYRVLSKELNHGSLVSISNSEEILQNSSR
tara:strand:- start:599 stop:1816 length:1218 start_codon:yes stop_codon:yes gene_type:complete